MRTKTFMPILLGKPRFLSPAQMRVRVANNLFQIHDSFQQCHVLKKWRVCTEVRAKPPRSPLGDRQTRRNATAPPKTESDHWRPEGRQDRADHEAGDDGRGNNHGGNQVLHGCLLPWRTSRVRVGEVSSSKNHGMILKKARSTTSRRIRTYLFFAPDRLGIREFRLPCTR